MRKPTLVILLALSFTAAALCPQTARADANVYWDWEGGFDPSTVIISPGETVYWWNSDMYGFTVHITVASSISFTLGRYQGYGVTFPYAGNYGMQSDWGDYGTVIVTLPPSVTITNPLDGATFVAPATLTIQATATDADGIYNVQFYKDSGYGTEWIDEDYTAPYSATTTFEEGQYTLTAYATDNNGVSSSDSISITVVSPTASIQLGNPRRIGSQFLFDVSGLTVGQTNVVQYCSNLGGGVWTSTATNVAAGATMTVTNSLAASPRFYRVYQKQ